jgi:hypothetical protein
MLISQANLFRHLLCCLPEPEGLLLDLKVVGSTLVQTLEVM